MRARWTSSSFQAVAEQPNRSAGLHAGALRHLSPYLVFNRSNRARFHWNMPQEPPGTDRSPIGPSDLMLLSCSALPGGNGGGRGFLSRVQPVQAAHSPM